MTNMVDTFLEPNLNQPIGDTGEFNTPEENLKNIIRDIVAKIGGKIKATFRGIKRFVVYLAKQWAEGARIHAQVSMHSRGGAPYYYHRNFC